MKPGKKWISKMENPQQERVLMRQQSRWPVGPPGPRAPQQLPHSLRYEMSRQTPSWAASQTHSPLQEWRQHAKPLHGGQAAPRMRPMALRPMGT